MRRIGKRLLSVFVTICLLLSITATAWAKVSDVKGNWAEAQINSWVEKGLIRGYSDGTFRPDKTISRAEFCALVNRSFGFARKGIADFSDVSAKDWFSDDISKAVAQGYLTGFPDKTAGPEKNITRQEVVTILARILKLKTNAREATGYSDDSRLAAWGRGGVAAVSRLGYINSYSDKSFRPDNAASRAEVVYILSNAIGTLYNKAGVYGPESGRNQIDGNITVNCSGITLKNMVITGNLYLSEGIGEGTVTLNNIIVRGTTTVCGGSDHGILCAGSTLGTVVNDPESKKTRLSEKAANPAASPTPSPTPSPTASPTASPATGGELASTGGNSGGNPGGSGGSNPTPTPTPDSSTPTPTPAPTPTPTPVTVAGVDTIEDQFVNRGTTLGAISLPTSVTLNLSNTSTCSALIASWNTSAYNPNTGGTYTLYGTFTPPSGIGNPLNIRAVANVTVIVGFTAEMIAEKNAVKGTAIQDVHLPTGVAIHLEDGLVTTAGIRWNTSSYRPGTLGTYTLTGNLTVPSGIGISGNATVSMRVNVIDPVIDPKPDTALISSNGTLVNEFDSLSAGISATNGILELDPRNKISGAASVCISSDMPSGGNFYLDTAVNANMADMDNLQFSFYIHDLSQIAHVSIRVYSGSSYFSRYIQPWRLVNGWNRITMARGEFITTEDGGTPNWSNITRISLMFFVNNGSKPSINVDRISYDVHARAKVLFTFDDGWYDLIDSSITDNAFSYMTSRGFRGTVWTKYYSSAYPGQEHEMENGNPIYMNETDLEHLYNAGWDIGNHTMSHPDNIAALSDDQIRNEYLQTQQWLVSQHWTRGAYFAAYPSGSYNEHMIEILQGIGVLAARTTEYARQSVPVDNMYKLKCIYPDETLGGLAELCRQVDDAIETGTTIFFMLHKVENSNDPRAVSINYFKQLVDYIDSRSSNIDVVTMSEWYNQYVGNPQPVVNITEVERFSGINVAYGTTVGAIRLPAQAEVTLSDGRSAEVNINWNTAAYNPTVSRTYAFTGTLVLPAGIRNPNSLTASVNVTVGAAPVVSVTTVSAISNISVAFGTTIGAIQFPAQATVTLSNSNTTSAGISWDAFPSYNPTSAGIYTRTGTLVLPSGITNPSGLKASVRVVVAAQPAITITTVSAISDIRVPYGTTDVAARYLPSRARVTLSNSTVRDLDVSWSSATYLSNVPGTYPFTGTFRLPDGITNPDGRRALVNVIVEPQPRP